ncbi:MAG: hypothetical protein RR561_07655 [Peptostreptococcus sp.]|uniref:hypothetical protein n=1 Tax=Peptostreptococcus sp. TaxID=1262 RepID=UPI002FC930DC
MIATNPAAIRIFIVTFIAMAINTLFPTIMYIRVKRKSEGKKGFFKRLIFTVIIPEILILLSSVYIIYLVVMRSLGLN